MDFLKKKMKELLDDDDKKDKPSDKPSDKPAGMHWLLQTTQPCLTDNTRFRNGRPWPV
jgi:hypothetical protein